VSGSGGQHQSIPRPGTAGAADRHFYSLAETYLDEMMRLNPFVATYNGYHRYDPLMDDVSAEGFAAKVAFYEDARRRFCGLDRAGLSLGAAIDLDLISTDIASSLFTLQELRPHENDPQYYNDMIGYGTLYLTILEEGDPAWPERLQALLSRMRSLPAFLQAARGQLKAPPPVVTQFIIEQNPGNISFFERALPPLFAHHPALKREFDAALPPVLEALRSYQHFLETELRSRSTGDWRLGRELWSRKLALSLQSDLPAAEIEQRAWQYLKRERQAMLEIAEPMYARMFRGRKPEGSGEERMNAILRDVIGEVSSRHSTADRLLTDCRRWVEKIIGFIKSIDYIDLPPASDNFVIEPTPAFLDGMAVAFFNPAPSFEPHLKKSFWISTIPKTGDAALDARRTDSYLREYNDYGLQNLSIHEAFPGHYVQFHHAQTSPIASIYKKVFASATFAEGWAVLCEEQMFQLGYAADEPEAMLIHKKMGLRAPMNAILDARMHSGALDEAEADRWALDLMQTYGFQEEMEAVRKLRRAKISSTQLSAYFVGYLELADLLKDYQRLKGPAFKMKEFNNRLLSYGTIPPRAVRSLMLEE